MQIFITVLLFSALAVAHPRQYFDKSRAHTYLVRRDSGYLPEVSVCGTGESCEEACGKKYRRCGSGDTILHCFNPSSGETCCGGNTGTSCGKGHYCANDNQSKHFCCPNGMSLEVCAASFSAVSLEADLSTSTSASTGTTTRTKSSITPPKITMTTTPTPPPSTLTPIMTAGPWFNATSTLKTFNPTNTTSSIYTYTGQASTLQGGLMAGFAAVGFAMLQL